MGEENKKIKVLQSVSSLGIGGNELFVMNLFRNVDKTKFQVDFVVYDERLDFENEVKTAGSKVFLCKITKGNKIVALFKEMTYVYKLLKENQYDVIHCNGCSFVNILRAVLPAKLVGNIKVISHAHSVGKIDKSVADNIVRNILKIILSNVVDLGFACSDTAGQSKYTKSFLASAKYHIINNAIEVQKYSFNERNRAEIREKYKMEDKIVFGNVGRLSYEKNQAFLLEILAELCKKGHSVMLLLIGGGALEQTLKQKASDLGVEDHVVFT
jgi:glycosyltransferase involved in cell wall biosynthesis